MDSTVYKYLLDELRTGQKKDASATFLPNSGFNLLPIYFLRSPLQVSQESFLNLNSFLKSIIEQHLSFSPVYSHFLFKNNNFFFLFFNAHKALLEILNGAETATHPFRSNGIQLLKFLTYCSKNGIPADFFNDDPFFPAMISFILEGMMFCGWCPDSFEGASKRAAHEYCVTLKKSLHHNNNNDLGAILGYMWGAWLFAQKTEGIRVTDSIFHATMQTFEWNMDSFKGAYIVEKTIKPPLFYLLSKCRNRLPHPFKNPLNDGIVGLSPTIENEPLKPIELVDYAEISRIKKHGHSFCYNCETDRIKGFLWTIIIMVFEGTFYRIDVFKFPLTIECAKIDATLLLENRIVLNKTGKNIYTGRSEENTIIEFIENPFELEFDRQLENGISQFSSRQKSISVLKPITMVTAWAQGKGVEKISRTYLLGIYD